MKIKARELRRLIRYQLIRENVMLDAWEWLKAQGAVMMGDTRTFIKTLSMN